MSKVKTELIASMATIDTDHKVADFLISSACTTVPRYKRGRLRGTHLVIQSNYLQKAFYLIYCRQLFLFMLKLCLTQSFPAPQPPYNLLQSQCLLKKTPAIIKSNPNLPGDPPLSGWLRVQFRALQHEQDKYSARAGVAQGAIKCLQCHQLAITARPCWLHVPQRDEHPILPAAPLWLSGCYGMQ